MVGRIAERRALWGELQAVHSAGRPRVVLLRGPRGIGSSRLAEWFGERAEELGAAHVLVGRWTDDEDALTALVGDALRVRGRDREWVARRLGETGHGSEETIELVLSAGVFSGKAERHAVFCRWLERYAAKVGRPLIVRLGDVGKSPISADIARALAGSTRLPALVLLTASDESLADALGEAIEDAADRTLRLGPLEPEEHAELVRATIPLVPSLRAWVQEHTRARPGRVEQAVGGWVAEGALEATRRGFRLKKGARPSLPSDIDIAWERRVEPLIPGASGHSLEIAAALGLRVLEVEWAGACRRAGVDPERGLLATLVAHRLAIIDSNRHSWHFRCEEVRDVLLQRAASRGRLQGAHRACAEVVHPDHAERLGIHRLGAGQRDEGIAALVRAAEIRTRQGDDVAATRAWRRLADAAGEVHPAIVRARIGLARLAWRIGDMEQWEARIDAALEAATGHDWPAERAYAWCSRANGHNRLGRPEEASRCFEKAMREARRAGDDEVLAFTRTRFARGIFHHAGRMDEALQLIGDAAEGYRRLGNRQAEAGALNWAANCLVSLGRHDEALDTVRRALKLVEGFAWQEANLLLVLGDLLRLAGDLEATDRAYAACEDRMRRLAHPDLPVLRISQAVAARGRVSDLEAKRLLQSSRPGGLRCASPLVVVCVDLALLPVLARLGDWEAGDRRFQLGAGTIEAKDYANVDNALLLEEAGRNARALGKDDRAGAARTSRSSSGCPWVAQTGPARSAESSELLLDLHVDHREVLGDLVDQHLLDDLGRVQVLLADLGQGAVEGDHVLHALVRLVLDDDRLLVRAGVGGDLADVLVRLLGGRLLGGRLLLLGLLGRRLLIRGLLGRLLVRELLEVRQRLGLVALELLGRRLGGRRRLDDLGLLGLRGLRADRHGQDDLGGAQDATVDRVAAHPLAEHRVFGLDGLLGLDDLVQPGIEVLAEGLDLLDAVATQRSVELLADHHDALLEALGVGVLERAPEVVGDVEQLEGQVLVRVLQLLGGLVL